MPNDALEVLQLIEEYEDLQKFEGLSFYSPYEKQTEFHVAGKDFAERCLGAGNQLGKTLAGSMEAAMHLTGLYPDDWEGERFDKPTVGWVGGDTGETIRDTTQKLLVGRMQDEELLGTGSIPKDYIIECVRAMGVKDLLDHVKVRHISGGTSLAFFKSYEKGRKKWQGETIDWVWFDEEPPQDIYSEGKTRTNNGQKGQFTWLTFTPLNGMTEVVMKFYQESERSKYQHLTLMTIHDVDHYSDEEREQIIESYPEHEREARSNGIPVMGSGKVFPIGEDKIKVEPFKIPDHWPRIKGVDFGWDHPASNVSIALDPDTDTIYVYDAYKEAKQTVEQHSSTINKTDEWIPVSWPHDALQHDRNSGKSFKELYEEEGVNMLSERATFEDGSNSVEAGNMAILGRMKSGKFKVFSHLTMYFEEFRLYHRKDGKIVKLRDDILDAVRYAIMMIRYAEVDWSDYEEEDDYRGDVGAMGY